MAEGEEIIGRLNGIWAPRGTIIGYHPVHLRFMAVAEAVQQGHLFKPNYILIRWATNEELLNLDLSNPRSIAEYRSVPQRSTVYGMARVDPFGRLSNWKPTGFLNKPSPHKRLRVVRDD